MSWPDDGQPRFVVDAQPTVRVLDRAYAHHIVTQVTSSHSRRTLLDHAEAVAEALNRSEADGLLTEPVAVALPVGAWRR